MSSAQALLAGRGWQRWQGGWQSDRLLVGHGRSWTLLQGGRRLASWDRLQDALAELWSQRTATDSRPWAVGWLGYSGCAELGGDLPAVADRPQPPTGIWLLEPNACDEFPLTAGAPKTGAGVCENLSDAQFAVRVETIRRAIADGRVYQVNLCRRFSVAPWAGGLRSLYDAASKGVQPDYLGAFSWQGRERGERGELVCASMEMLLRRRGAKVVTRPIKGTRGRGQTPESDERLKEGLATDPKELAELAMIVDLERNDIGKVAKAGSVVVTDPGSVHSWAVVHHRVAEVCAEVDRDMSPWELFGAMAPGGSVTGCPKIAAMEMIRDLETVPRGPFTGALGVVAGNGDAEIALPIRTGWLAGDRVEMASGCGIVWESRADEEVKESRVKISQWLDLMREVTR